MTVAIGLWSLQLTPGENQIVHPPADIKITNVALGEVLKDTTGRSTVKLTFEPPGNPDSEDEDEENSASITTVLCSLKPDMLEQTTTDIVLQEDETYKFEVTGKNIVYLTGNYIEQAVNNPPFDDDASDISDSEEDAYDLREVSSDVEMHPDELESDASRFEEVEEAAKNLKRPREPESEAETETTKLSKAEKRKKKKLKAEAAKQPDANKESGAALLKESDKGKDGVSKSQTVEKEITGGIKIVDGKVGTGPMAKKGNTVRMRYIGKLTDGKVFDKNIKGKPFTFHLGKGQVIKGWDEGIVGMQVGGERKLTIPPSMAYGQKGTEGIPKNATLVFEVKLLEIK